MSEISLPLETKHFNIIPKNESKVLQDDWDVVFKETGKSVGTIRFESAVLHGEIELAADLEPSYDKAHFVEEIYYEMARFVFKAQDIREISTVVRHENEHRVKGIEKAGYVRRKSQDGDDYYSMKKLKTTWQGLYMFIGLVAGFIIGITIANLWIGTAAGVVIGSVMGYLMDKKEDK